MTPAPVQVAPPADAKCMRHAVPAIASCRRCGSFVCSQDSVLLDGSVFCSDCAARPDVDYLEAFRLEYWGKRDSWAWFFGVGGLFNLLTGLAIVAGSLVGSETRAIPMGLVVMLVGVVGLLFWFGFSVARWLLLGGVLLLGFVQAAVAGPAALVSIIFPLAIVGSAIANTRNKLFFKLPVERAALKKSWDVLHNNTLARNAATLGVVGVLMGVFAPFAIIAGIIGLRRVDPTAHPPIGYKGHAIAGIVLGIIGSLFWGAVLAAALTGKL